MSKIVVCQKIKMAIICVLVNHRVTHTHTYNHVTVPNTVGTSVHLYTVDCSSPGKEEEVLEKLHRTI